MLAGASAGRVLPLVVLLLLFAASALAVGRREGLRCLATLIVIPLLLLAMGWSVVCMRLPVGPTVLVAGALALGFQVFLLTGWRNGALGALLGAGGGYLIALVLAVVAVFGLQITGIYSPLLKDLWYAPGTEHVNFHWLALGGIALAGAGIIADLAVAVTATLREVHAINPMLGSRDLFRSGMRFGRDVICTEINTLPLAILGASMGGVLLVLVKPDVQTWEFTWMRLTNRQSTAVEAGALLAGTIGLALTIPLTAFLISRWWKRADEAQQRHAPPPAPAKGLFSVGGLLLIAAALTVVAFVWLGHTSHSYFREEGPAEASLMRGKVLSAEPAVSPWAPREKGPGKEIMQHLNVRLSNGREVAALNALQLSPVNDRVPQVGERAIFLVAESDPDMPAMLIEIERDRGLLLMVFAACMVVVLVGRWQGWRAVGALAVCLALVGVLLVSIVRLGTPPILTTLMYMLVVTGLTFLIICGWNHKALGATAGALAGLAAAGVAALAFGSWLGLSGLYDRDMQTLFWRSAGRGLDFQALLTSAALVGALGVVMDVSIGIASAVSEVRRANPATPFRPLLSAGFAVGRKIMAAMFGAILFAYLGLNIGLFLLPWAETGSAWQALENERVRSEVFRIGIAGLAIVWSIPATAVISAYLASRKTQTVVTADVEES